MKNTTLRLLLVVSVVFSCVFGVSLIGHAIAGSSIDSGKAKLASGAAGTTLRSDGTKWIAAPPAVAIAPTVVVTDGTYTIDFADPAGLRLATLGGAVTISASNIEPDYSRTLVVILSASTATTLTFDAGVNWGWLGTKPTALNPGMGGGMLVLTGAPLGVIASWREFGDGS